MSLEHSPARAGVAQKERGADADEDGAQPPRARVILRWPEVRRLTGKSRTTVWRNVRAGTFPAPIQIGGDNSHAVGWFEDEVVAWQEARPRAYYAPAGQEAA